MPHRPLLCRRSHLLPQCRLPGNVRPRIHRFGRDPFLSATLGAGNASDRTPVRNGHCNPAPDRRSHGEQCCKLSRGCQRGSRRSTLRNSARRHCVGRELVLSRSRAQVEGDMVPGNIEQLTDSLGPSASPQSRWNPGSRRSGNRSHRALRRLPTNPWSTARFCALPRAKPTTGRLAARARAQSWRACFEDGKIREGQIWRQESIVGSIFEGAGAVRDGKVYPSIKGSAFVNADAETYL